MHVHNQWGVADAAVLDALGNGATGIWCSLCEEGSAMGHSCSAVTIGNLARLGNKKVVDRYNCSALASGAQLVTELSCGQKPNHRQVLYGPRAIEVVFDFAGIAGGLKGENDDQSDPSDFCLATFLGSKDAPVRITALSSARLVCKRLRDLFGDDPNFTEEVAGKMMSQMEIDLARGAREEYSSAVGLAYLYCKVKGKLTERMVEVVDKAGMGNEGDPALKNLIESRVKRTQKPRVFDSYSVFKANLSGGPVLLWTLLFARGVVG